MAARSLSLVVIVLLGALSGVPAHAEEEQRMDVKGMHLGDRLEQMRTVAKLICKPDKSLGFDTTCTYSESKNRVFADERAEVTFGLFGDRLDSVMVQLSGNSYDRIKAALDGKFGAVEPAVNTNGLCTYRMNGDRAHLTYLPGHVSFVLYEAAAGAAERERRATLAREKTQKSM